MPTNKTTEQLIAEGFREGDVVPGGGVITPSGEIQQTPGVADVNRPATFAPQPSSMSDIEKRLEEIRQQALAVQESANRLAEKEKSSLDGAVVSSDRIINDERDITSRVEQALSGSDTEIDSIRKASEDLQAELKKREDELESRRSQEVQSIEQDFGEQQQQLDDAQRKEFAARRVALARIGGFLGESASAVSNLRSLTEEHNREDSLLQSKKRAAIQEAKNAISDKQFEIARERLAEAKKIEEDVSKRRQDFFDRALDLVREQRQQDEFRLNLQKDARSTVQNILDTYGTIDFSLLSEESQADLFEMALTAGIPPEVVTSSFTTIKQEELKNKRDDEAFNREIDLANLAIRRANLQLSQQKQSEGSRLSAVDAQRLNLPRSLVGRTEDEIFSDFQDTIPPSWYEDYIRQQQLASGKTGLINMQELQDQWNRFRNEALEQSSSYWYAGPVGGFNPDNSGEVIEETKIEE